MKIKTILILISACFFSAAGYAEIIGLQWDAVDDVDGYRIYQSIRAENPDTGIIEHSYDYTAPVVTDEYPEGNIPADVTQITIDLPGVQNDDTKYMFVARAFRGDQESENSNEVDYVVSLVQPLPASELAGSYNKNDGIINLQWDQASDEYSWRTISHWIIYYRIDGGEWIAIGRIGSDQALTLEAPFTAVPDGEQKTIEFVVVSYRRSGVYSANSDVFSIDVDRREVPPIQNLRINIEIPVL